MIATFPETSILLIILAVFLVTDTVKGLPETGVSILPTPSKPKKF